MMWIQVLLVVVALGLILWLSRQKSTAISAFKKTGLVLLALLMVITVLFPELTTVIAHALGIGRGADLLLYGLTATFVVYAVTQYLRAQANRSILFALARRLALQEASDTYGLRRPSQRPVAPGPG